MSDESVRLVPKGDIALVELDLKGKSANVLSGEVLLYLKRLLQEIKSSSFKALVFISRKKNIFIAGADIGEIQKAKRKEDFQVFLENAHGILNGLEDLSIPVIVAIHGACLGGGLELSLACDYRICTDSYRTKIGLPEVRLGLIPGYGGCIRLPQVVGFQNALDLILNGKSVDGKKALKMGLVDQCVGESELEERALEFAFDLIQKKKMKRKKMFQARSFSQKFKESFFGRILIKKIAQKTLLSKTKGFYPAPFKALEVISKTYKDSRRERSLKIESKAFLDVVLTDVAKNLIGLFYLMERVKKRSFNASLNVREKVKKLGVLGAGTMGGGIAYAFADRGFFVRIKDLNNEALGLALSTAYQLWGKGLKRKKLSLSDFEKKMNLVGGSTTYEGFQNIDFVIEAVVEDMAIKKTVIEDCAKRTHENTVIGTNTSSLSVNEMAKAHPRPENFVGMHFFNPVDKMPLVEIIRGEKSSDEAMSVAYYLAKEIGKTPVIVKDGPGFLVNRLLLPYLAEALFLLEEGMEVKTLDSYYTEHFGMPMGPLRLLDEIGLDVAFKVLKIFAQAFKERVEVPSFLQKIISTERLGKKTGKGFYLYSSKGKCLSVDPSLSKDLELPFKKNVLSQKECLERGIFLMVNEATRALDDKIVDSPKDVDLAMIFGIGFPPFRGGLLRYADEVGVKSIASSLESYFSSYKSERFKPSKALVEMVKEGKTFYE